MIFAHRSQHPSLRQRHDQRRQGHRDEHGQDMTLHDDTILQQTHGFVLDPDRPGEDPLQQRFLPVLVDPQLVVEGVARAERVHRDAATAGLAAVARGGHAVDLVRARSHGSFFVVVAVVEGVEASAVAVLFPGSKGAAVARVDDDAEALVGGDADVEADEEEGEAPDAPPARRGGADQEDGEDDGSDDVGDARVANEEDARLVAVANAPADEVGVGLPAQGAFDNVMDQGEGGGVGGVLEGVEDGGAGLVGEIEFTRGVWGDVVRDNSVDLGAEGLYGDCNKYC